MTCASCASRIERKLNRLDSVDASVNYATEKATVRFDPTLLAPSDLVSTIEAAGYHARLPAPPLLAATPSSDDDRDHAVDALRARLIGAALLSAPLLVLAMVPPLQFRYRQWLALQLATPVVLWAGWPFHRAAWLNLRHRTATMDTLISIGTLAAWSWSIVALFLLGAGKPGMRMSFDVVLSRDTASGHIYLEVAGVVTTLILAGRYFEARAKRRAGAAVRALLALGARDATLLAPDGSETRVPAESLRVGQAFVVRPGERIATDGIVVEGASAVDE